MTTHTPSSESLAPRATAPLHALLLAALLLLFLPTWLWLFDAWLSDPYYSHGPLVVIVSLYFAWARRNALITTKSERRFLTERRFLSGVPSLALLVAALAVHLWATLWRAYYISALTIPFALSGLLFTLYGWRITRQFLFPLAFLFLMVPLPLAERFGPMLEGWTATSATVLAQWLGIAAHNEGALVFLPASTFTVGIPCGGLRSAIAIITLVTLFAYIVRGPLWARGAIFLAAIPIALVANTFRVSLLFAIASAWGAQVGLDYFHSWSSPVLFLSAFALLVALARIIGASGVRWQVILPS